MKWLIRVVVVHLVEEETGEVEIIAGKEATTEEEQTSEVLLIKIHF